MEIEIKARAVSVSAYKPAGKTLTTLTIFQPTKTTVKDIKDWYRTRETPTFRHQFVVITDGPKNDKMTFRAKGTFRLFSMYVDERIDVIVLTLAND